MTFESLDMLLHSFASSQCDIQRRISKHFMLHLLQLLIDELLGRGERETGSEESRGLRDSLLYAGLDCSQGHL